MGWIILAILLLIAVPLVFHISLGFIGIIAIAIIFWFSMLIDCLQRQENNFPLPGQHEKLIWSLVLIFLNTLGAILYFSLVLLNTDEKNIGILEKMA
jgi:hypothetical protein